MLQCRVLIVRETLEIIILLRRGICTGTMLKGCLAAPHSLDWIRGTFRMSRMFGGPSEQLGCAMPCMQIIIIIIRNQNCRQAHCLPGSLLPLAPLPTPYQGRPDPHARALQVRQALPRPQLAKRRWADMRGASHHWISSPVPHSSIPPTTHYAVSIVTLTFHGRPILLLSNAASQPGSVIPCFSFLRMMMPLKRTLRRADTIHTRPARQSAYKKVPFLDPAVLCVPRLIHLPIPTPVSRSDTLRSFARLHSTRPTCSPAYT